MCKGLHRLVCGHIIDHAQFLAGRASVRVEVAMGNGQADCATISFGDTMFLFEPKPHTTLTRSFIETHEAYPTSRMATAAPQNQSTLKYEPKCHLSCAAADSSRWYQPW